MSSAPMERYRKNEAPINQKRASASNPWARLSFWIPVRETAAIAITAAAIAKPRITRSEKNRSTDVASVSARYRKYTAARSQIKAIAPRVGAAARPGAKNAVRTIETIDAAMAK